MQRGKTKLLYFSALILAALALSACRQEVRFTNIPVPVVGDVGDDEAKSGLTTVFVAVPIRLSSVAARLDQAIPGELKRFVAWLDDIACFKRKTYVQCEGARTDLYLSRDGAVKITPAGNQLNLEIPFKYVLKARGLGPARTLTETKTGRLVAVAGLKVQLQRGLTAKAELARSIKWSRREIKVMNGAFRLADHADGRIRRLLRDMAQSLTAALQNAPIRASAKQVWDALHAPIKLHTEPNIWLSTKPERIADGGFASRNGQTVYQIAIGTRMRVVTTGVEPVSYFAAPMPRRGERFDGQQRSILRRTVAVKYDAFARALKAAWPAPIEMPGAMIRTPMRVHVNDVELFPSRDLLAVGLDLDVETPDRAFDLTGMAYLTARPVLELKKRILTLRDVKLAKPNVIAGIGAGTGKRLRLSAAPFVAGIKQSVKVDVARPLDNLLGVTNAMLNRDIGNDLWLHGRFETARAALVRPRRDGLQLDVDLVGELYISSGALQTKAATIEPATKTQ